MMKLQQKRRGVKQMARGAFKLLKIKKGDKDTKDIILTLVIKYCKAALINAWPACQQLNHLPHLSSS